MAAYIAWLIMFHNNKEVLIIANKKDVAKNMLYKVKVILAHMPEWMYLTDQIENNVHTITFSNGSKVKSVARSDDAGRSEAVSLLVLDEAAHIDRMDELWKGAASTISTGGHVVALSTPAGSFNWFHEYFTKAENGEIDWYPFITHWWENPVYAEGIEDDPNVPGGRTSPWFKKTTEGWSRQQIAQELLTSFIESGETYFSVDTMEYYASLSQEPISKEGPDRNLWIWKNPQHGYRYLISADSCEGSGTDYCGCHVIELMEMEVVAEYKGKMPPDVFGDFLVELGEKYNNAYICPESQGIGKVTCYRIKNLNYRNLCYFDKESKRLIDQWTAEYKGIAPGQPMTVVERTYILAKTEEYLRKHYVRIYSKRFANEMRTFVNKNNKPQAANNANDDLVMSLAIGIWVRDACPEFRGIVGAESIMKTIEAISKTTTTYKSTNSVEFRVEQHKKKIRNMLDQQKIPLNPHNIWLYKV